MSISIKKVPATTTYPIRHSVLRPNQDYSSCTYTGDEDATTFHLGAFDIEKLIGIASFYRASFEAFNQSRQYQLRGMATLPQYQGMKIGKKLIEEAEIILKEQQAELWWCNARLSAIGFYEKLGLTIYGDLFEIEGIGPHKVMFRELM